MTYEIWIQYVIKELEYNMYYDGSNLQHKPADTQNNFNALVSAMKYDSQEEAMKEVEVLVQNGCYNLTIIEIYNS